MRTSLAKTLFLILSMAGSMCATKNLQAAEIQGVTVTASSEFINYGASPFDIRNANNLVSSTGLNGDYVYNTAPGSQWLTDTNGGTGYINGTNYLNGVTNYFIGPVGTNYLVFNLGGLYTVNAIKVWNYNESGQVTKGLKTGIISYSVDGINWTTNIASQNFTEAPGSYSVFPQTITMPSPISAQYIQISCVTNWSTAATNANVGLAKVRFISNTNPPTLVSAYRNFGNNQMTVYFSETMDQTSLTNLANYSISGSPTSPTIYNAVVGAYADRVILYTSPLTNSSYTVSVSGVYDEALTATVTNNSEAPVRSEVYLWLKPDAGVSVDANNEITQWNDQSSYGHNAVPQNGYFPPTAAGTNWSAPYLVPNVINGYPAAQFFGTNALIVPDDAANRLNGDFTVFFLWERSVIGPYLDPINKNGGNSFTSTNIISAPWDCYTLNSAGNPQFRVLWGNGSGDQNFTTPTLIPTNNTPILMAISIKNGTSGLIYTNGAQSGATTGLIYPGHDDGNPICIGVQGTYGKTPSGTTFQGYIPEILIIDGTITPSDLGTIDYYFKQKYNLPIATPTITEQPANATAQVGHAATFWVNSTGSGLAYQWYSNSVAIAGATAAVYTTPPLTLAANGAQYTVSVTSGPTITSSPATLTVVPDVTPPAISSATKAAGSAGVIVVYSEYVSPATALNTANYSLNGATVLGAQFGAGSASNQVVLTTTTLSTNIIYLLSVSNVDDLAGNSIVGTTVPLMPSGMVLWLRAGHGVVTNANAANPSAVDAWLDQSPCVNNAAGYTYLNGNVSYRPTLGTDSVDGASAVLFNNANYLTVANSQSVAITSNMTVCVMYNMSDYTPYHSILGKTTSASPIEPNPYDIYSGNAANYQGLLRFGRGNGTSSTFVGSSTVAAAGSPHFHTIVMNGTSVSYTVDGAADGNATLSQATTDGGQPLIIGSRNSLDIFMSGDMQEVMIFSNAISSTDLAAVEDYIGGAYYPLTVTQSPANVTTNVGATATFSVTASQGSAQLTYQWLENGTNIPGATSPSYTTPVLAPGDNGELFSVIVGAPGSSSTTVGPATLTVLNNPPTIISAGQAIWSSNLVVIVFSEGVLPSTATNTANYSITGVTVRAAAIGQSPNEVILTTSPLTVGTIYQLTVQNLSNLYGATMPSPITVSTGLYPPMALWVKASSGVSADSSGNVSQWSDLSGNGNTLTDLGYGPPYDPILVTNASDYPVLRFDGTNGYFSLMVASDAASLRVTNDMTVFAVVNFTTLQGGTNGEIIAKTGASGTVAGPYDYNVNASSVLLNRGNGTSAAYVSSAAAPSIGVTHLLDVEMQGTSVTHRLDGANNGTGTLSTAIADAGQPMSIGFREDSNNRLTGDISEIILVGSALSPGDVGSIEGYLAGEYGIQLPVQVNTNPTNIVLSVTNNALYLSWPANHMGWQLQAQTNSLSVGLGTNWINYDPSTGTNQVVIPVNLTNGSVFYRLIYKP